MAFALRIERQFPLALTYRGPVAVLEFEFSFFFPRGADDLALLLDVALFSIDVLPIIQANYLRYTIESDEIPTPDRYRVKIMLAGEVERAAGTLSVPFSAVRAPQGVFAIPPLLVIVVAIGIALLFAVIIWRTYQVTRKPLGLVLVVGAIALGVGAAYYIAGPRRSNA